MKVIANAGPLPERMRRCVAAIGIFDGVHRGHQAVIARAVAEARRCHVPSVVVTFFPHPVAVLRPRDFAGYVMTLEQRLSCIEALGADVCYVIPFTRAFSRLTARQFIDRYLVLRLRAVKVVVGADFYFGCQRTAAADAISAGTQPIALIKIPLIKLNNNNIKTKLIRELVSVGDLVRLRRFLGRDYSLRAEVEQGFRLGRRLGFPTANLKRENVIFPPTGIYLSRVWAGQKKYPALFYIGFRPSLHRKEMALSLEAHLLDFKGRLYGKVIQADLLKKLRDDRTFSDEKDLAAAIARDVSCARVWFRSHPV